MRRVVIPELLDSGGGNAAQLEIAFADLRRINSWFGGVSVTRRLIERVAENTGRRELTLLDVASGAGYVPQTVARALAPRGIELQITLSDRIPVHLNGWGRCVAADAQALPFADASFDIVSCSLFTHHLEPEQLARFAAEGLRVCRAAVLINDVRRSLLHLALVYAGLPLFRSPLTHHDAPASVRRAYTPQEIASILKTTGAHVEMRRYYLYRLGILLWRDRHA